MQVIKNMQIKFIVVLIVDKADAENMTPMVV